MQTASRQHPYGMRGYYSAKQTKCAIAKEKRRSKENTLPEQDISQNKALRSQNIFSYALILLYLITFGLMRQEGL
jgi:hypothetical protein